MKLFHLSDLHLGKRIHEVSMLEDQIYILDRILSLAVREKPDAILIAGDIYDRSVPSAEAVTLFDGFLSRLSREKIPVLVISGNHDSPERLAFGGQLMAGAGVYLSPVYSGTVSPVVLSDAFGPVNIYLLPFLKPAHVRRFFPEAQIESYTDALRVAVEQMSIDPSARNILVTHQFVTGAAVCDSEELSVGGSENVDVSVFEDFDYVALGHIHGPQNIQLGKLRYCGTPLKYSFSEAHHKKSITVVELGEKGRVTVDTIPLEPLRDLRELRGSYLELTDKSAYEGTAREDYLHIILTDEEDVPEAMGRLRTVYPNILKLTYDNRRTRFTASVDTAGEIDRKTPLELFAQLYELQNNQPMSAQQAAYTQTLIESIWEEDA